MAKSSSNRILNTPSSYAKQHYLYVQEVGTLQSIEPHISRRQNLDSYLFFIVLQGSGTLTYEGETCAISAGDCAWIDCASPYSHESSDVDPWRLAWVHFTGNQARHFYQYFRQTGHSFLFRPSNPSVFIELLDTLFQSQYQKSSLMELYANRYITDLIAYCFDCKQEEESGDYSIKAKLQLVHTYLEEHFAEKINLEDLYSRFFISKFHLSREYKKNYGVTILNDLVAIRISHAKSLLRFSDTSIEQIALSCGFQDAGYFIKVFRNAEGMTPLVYRKKW